MEDFRKKESTRNLGNKKFLKSNKTTVGSHSSSIDKVEDRISGLKDKIDINEKTEEFLDKRLKSCERNMQELSDSIKRPKL
jgi:chromosome segregation ATPase